MLDRNQGVRSWPSWARHIKHVDVFPTGPIGPTPSGVFHLGYGLKSKFVMTEFNLPNNWKWSGPFLNLKIHYDHRFEVLNVDRCKLVWMIDAEGFGVSTIGRIFATNYNRNLDQAIPKLINELNSSNQNGQ